MDFDDTPEEAAFRVECRAWLDAHATLRNTEDSRVWRMYRPRDRDEDLAALHAARAWQSTKADAGYAGIAWPVELGGRGLSAHLAAIFAEEEARYDVPANFFQVGVEMVGPTLMQYGSPDQRERFLDVTRRGELMWCQLFSEPGAGSDLAALSTRAERDGDEWVVNGQKVWTTAAQMSDWAILLVRTNPDAPKHRGITFLLLDMTTPGVDVRPLRQIDGAAHFNEVFLTDVRVPLDAVVGSVDDGWRVAVSTLTHERSAIAGGGMVQWSEIRTLAETMGRIDDPVIRQHLARTWSYFTITRLLGARVRTAVSHGRMPGPESSVMKLHISRQYETGGDLLCELLGPAATLGQSSSPYGGFFQDVFLGQWAPRLGGGTDQVQRNIAGERVLGLPAEPRVDKDVAFRDLPR